MELMEGAVKNEERKSEAMNNATQGKTKVKQKDKQGPPKTEEEYEEFDRKMRMLGADR